MRFKLRFSLWLLVLGIIVVYSDVAGARLCRGAPGEYVIEEIRGKVVDETTGQPIEGAIVLAFWKTIQPQIYLKIEESMTDSNGEFFFPDWGPIKRPDKSCFWDGDPYLQIFQPGYYQWDRLNTYFGEHGGSPEETLVNPVPSRIRKSRFNRETIKLRKFVIGAEIEYTSPLTNKPAKRNLTEQDWCNQIDHMLLEFVIIEVEFSLPKLFNTMHREKIKHPDCFKQGQLNQLEKQ